MSKISGTADEPASEPSQAEQRRHRAEVWHTTLICLLMVALYYLVPIEPDVSGVHRVVRAVITTVGVVLVATMVLLQIRRQITVDPSDMRLARLAITLVGGVIAFALADLVISFSDPGQFVNMTTKTDALYFAIGTLTTVGYGDVHANGQVARAAVCVQMLFSVGVLATGASLLVKRWIERADRQPAAR
ncbi:MULTISPECIES: potassium channel family protein [unclassified Solwaraspora]|uniref:potassium channel family protein n=1 Tax=unclassified Solwaraspora TaxID=2627926 RepID=UPI00259B64E9|nr:potassium channel family protein [Solwaraspora sp. WMMA2056]WJK39663.1 potassium channel family protein [Solwaraspora sp. WMMA2056]